MVTPVLAHGGMGGLMEFFPFLFIGAAIIVIVTAMRDGSGKKNNTTTLPSNNLSRQLHFATRRPRRERPVAVQSAEKAFRRNVAPHLKVMEGEADGNRPAIPRRFEPPPPRRKTG